MLCSSPQGRLTEIPKERGFQKYNFIKESMWGIQTEKPSVEGGMDIFWKNTITIKQTHQKVGRIGISRQKGHDSMIDRKQMGYSAAQIHVYPNQNIRVIRLPIYAYAYWYLYAYSYTHIRVYTTYAYAWLVCTWANLLIFLLLTGHCCIQWLDNMPQSESFLFF